MLWTGGTGTTIEGRWDGSGTDVKEVLAIGVV